jgi:RHS repeat-associated protein
MVHSEARHYPYGEERWRSGTLPTDYRFAGQRSLFSIKLYQMGARFYDSALGRWISADTIVPDPANPQSLNRLSYALGNPLRYRDPTGHIEQDEADRAKEIIAILAGYNVLIGIDFWLQEIVMHPGPGEPSCNIWHTGAWELSTMEAVLQGVQDMASAMGGQESFKQTFSQGLRFERGSMSRNTPLAGAEAFHRTITIFDRGADLQDFAGLRSTVAHELAHAWDQESGGELSRGLVEITGGQINRNGFWISDFNVWGAEVYIASGPLHRRAAASRGEDWAYSVEAWVLGHDSPRSALTVDRQFYLRNRFPGIMGAQRGAR